LLLAGFVLASLVIASSCAQKATDASMKLPESVYGFYLGETQKELFKRAKGVATLTRTSSSRFDYRGDLWRCSAPLVYTPGVDHVRLGFFHGRLWEIVIYFKNTSAAHLDDLKNQLEAKYDTHAVSPSGTIEMAAKTYWLSGPGMSITLRRITKKNSTDLYVQYFHEKLHEELMEKNKEKQE
jgi:hypothetical protein